MERVTDLNLKWMDFLRASASPPNFKCWYGDVVKKPKDITEEVNELTTETNSDDVVDEPNLLLFKGKWK